MTEKICKTCILGESCRERTLTFPDERLQSLRDRGIEWGGVGEMRGAYEIRRHGLSSHLTVYTLNGSGWLKSDGIETVLKSGQLWLSPAGTAQEYGLAGESWELVWFYLADRPPWRIRESGVRPSPHGPRLQHGMNGLLMELDQSSPSPPFNRDLLDLYGQLILRTLREEIGSQGGQPQDHRGFRLQQLLTHIRSNLQQVWSVEAMAAWCDLHISTQHFVRLFRTAFEVSPMRLVTELRMGEARNLLLNTDYPHYTIAQRVGYTNPYAFSTAFKRQYGHSPRDYQKIVTKNSDRRGFTHFR
ncbi:MAG: helix-turn-helix domain-containing protein [Planctomycetota bacterium]|jgi:AraC-like DNA-binding protein